MTIGSHWLSQRIYQDFLMPSRLQELRSLLMLAREKGYRVISVEEWAEQVEQGQVGRQRVLVLRHDIDTDSETGLAMAKIEHELGANASFFFRLSTFDSACVDQIRRLGFHVSYHYEELATWAKRQRVTSEDIARLKLPEVKAEFARNITDLRSRFGLPMDIVCSHGDWKNRQLGLPNHVILADRDFREKWRIRWETYDAELAEPLVARTADAPLPRLWIPDSPVSSISRAESPVYLLLHPRQWRSAIWANGRATSVRMLEAFQDRVPLRVRQKQSATDQLQE